MRAINTGNNDIIRFNMLIIGGSSNGKTTFLKNLFSNYVSNNDIERISNNKTNNNNNTINFWISFDIKTNTGNINIRVFSINYGNLIDNSSTLDLIQTYLLSKHEVWSSLSGQNILESERSILDERIHLGLLFLSQHEMSLLDQKLIKRTGNLMNILCIVSKSDIFRDKKEIDDYKNDASKKIKNINEKACMIYNFYSKESNVNDSSSPLPSPSPSPLSLSSPSIEVTDPIMLSSFINLGIEMNSNFNDENKITNNDDDKKSELLVENDEIISLIKDNIFMINDNVNNKNDMEKLLFLLFENNGEINKMREKTQLLTMKLSNQYTDFVLKSLFILIATFFSFGYILNCYIRTKLCTTFSTLLSLFYEFLRLIGTKEIEMMKTLCTIQSKDVIIMIMLSTSFFLLTRVYFLADKQKKYLSSSNSVIIIGLIVLSFCLISFHLINQHDSNHIINNDESMNIKNIPTGGDIKAWRLDFFALD